MILKRKRSGSELSTSASSTTATPPRANQTILMDISPASSSLNSRTMKRFRNNRPSDDEVHRKFYEWRAHHRLGSVSSSSCVPERTLNLLYSAQQGLSPPAPSCLVSQQFPQCQPQQQPTFQQEQQQQQAPQQNLHRFFNINSAPAQGLAIQTPVVERPAGCEDCGAGLEDGMDVDGGADDTACGACGKHVCYSCSVSNLGEQKRCLQCAGRRVWIGGIGWTNADVSVC